MKKPIQFLLVMIYCITSTLSFGQDGFTTCSAAFVGSKMVVNEYTKAGKCNLLATATGELTVCTVTLSPTESKAIDKIDFRVAIRDKTTNTLRMFSGDTFQTIPVQRVLATCKKGDSIVLLTVDDRYALPHNEILVL